MKSFKFDNNKYNCTENILFILKQLNTEVLSIRYAATIDYNIHFRLCKAILSCLYNMSFLSEHVSNALLM